MWPPQASGRHCFNIRNQSFPPVFVPVHHDVIATRQQGDELRVMDICIGTFPFPRQPLFTLKALHIIHQYCPPGQVLHPRTRQTHMWRHFLPPHPPYCSPLHHLSDSEQSDSKLCHLLDTSRHMNKELGGILLKGSWIEKKVQFNTTFNLFHKLQQRGLKGRQ